MAQGIEDSEKPIILFDASILRASSIRLILSSVAQQQFLLFSYDIAQAYLQSKRRLTLNTYIELK